MKETFLLILKFVIAVLLLPVIMGITFAFQTELATFEPAIRHSLVVGMGSYILIRFFVYDFAAVYTFGQGMVTAVFQFLKPLVNAAPYVLPIYTLILLCAYAIFAVVGKMTSDIQHIFLFFLAFTFTMHIVLTAQDLYTKDTSAGKPNYFFGMALVYIVDVFLMALVMSLVLKGFSFTSFFKTLTSASADVYLAIIRQLF